MTPISDIGPLVKVAIETGEPCLRSLREAGVPAPRPIECVALIDTGSNVSYVSYRLAATLGVAEQGRLTVHQFGAGLVDVPYYLFGMTVHFTDGDWLKIVDKAACGFTPAAARGQPLFEAVLGNDALRFCRLEYDGGAGRFSLTRAVPQPSDPSD